MIKGYASFLYDIRGNFMGLCVFSVDYDVRDQNS